MVWGRYFIAFFSILVLQLNLGRYLQPKRNSNATLNCLLLSSGQRQKTGTDFSFTINLIMLTCAQNYEKASSLERILQFSDRFRLF